MRVMETATRSRTQGAGTLESRLHLAKHEVCRPRCLSHYCVKLWRSIGTVEAGATSIQLVHALYV